MPLRPVRSFAPLPPLSAQHKALVRVFARLLLCLCPRTVCGHVPSTSSGCHWRARRAPRLTARLLPSPTLLRTVLSPPASPYARACSPCVVRACSPSTRRILESVVRGHWSRASLLARTRAHRLTPPLFVCWPLLSLCWVLACLLAVVLTVPARCLPCARLAHSRVHLDPVAVTESQYGVL